MTSFINLVENQLNVTTTDNEAITPISTKNHLLDFFYHGAALRNELDDNRVIQLFSNAFSQDKLLALKTLFYIRDIRGGQGERKVFRTITSWLSINYPEVIVANIPNFAVYGRYDDLIELIVHDTVKEPILDYISKTINNEKETGAFSNLPKWLPSGVASSKHTRKLANIIRQHIGLTSKEYRKFLTEYRTNMTIIETQMCAKKWSDIKYEQVPSKANLKYKKAFKKQDTDRYTKYIESVAKGETKINASTLYPYELVKGYLQNCSKDDTIEALWNNLPNYCEEEDNLNSIVVADVSGSMHSPEMLPISVSISLAIYFAQRNKGAFKDTFLTFSDIPQLMKLNGNNLFDIVTNLSRAPWGMSTNIQAIFDLILGIATTNKLKQSDIPNRIFIVSDMQFNTASDNTRTNYQVIEDKYKASGYEIPRLVFWNVNSTNNQVPITIDNSGTFLVSGLSPSIFKNVLKSKVTSAEEMMLEVINQERYVLVSV